MANQDMSVVVFALILGTAWVLIGVGTYVVVTTSY